MCQMREFVLYGKFAAETTKRCNAEELLLR